LDPNDIVAHLHMGNYAADLSLQGGEEFASFVRRLAELGRNAARHLDATHAWLGGIKNGDLLLRWRDFYRETAGRFVAAEPKQRVKWFGPDMSVLSSISARLMETWAHGQGSTISLAKPAAIPTASRTLRSSGSIPSAGLSPTAVSSRPAYGQVSASRLRQERYGNGRRTILTI
jgi:hypothetical protein